MQQSILITTSNYHSSSNANRRTNMSMKPVTLNYVEDKKHSFVYVVDGTENDQYPNKIYVRRDWLNRPATAPKQLIMSFEVK